MPIKLDDKTATRMIRETIQHSPLDAMKNVLAEVEAGRISLSDVVLDTTQAKSGSMEFSFRATAHAQLTPADVEGLVKMGDPTPKLEIE